jgi:hypothetical protein
VNHFVTNGSSIDFDWSLGVLNRTKMESNGTSSLMSFKLELGVNLWPLMGE